MGNDHGPSEPAGPEVGLLKDEGWSQRQTWSCDCAAGLSARKGPQAPAFRGTWFVCSERPCACRERPLAELGVSQGGVGK